MMSFILGGIEFSRSDEEHMTILLSSLFDACTKRDDLYGQISNETIEVLDCPLEAGTIISEEKALRFISTLKLMGDLYGHIYDPHGLYFRISKTTEVYKSAV